MGILLGTPHYGEETSGDELERTNVIDLERMGFKQCEGIPCMHTFWKKGRDRPHVLIRLVDDFLLKVHKDPEFIDLFEAAMKKVYGQGVKFDREAKEYASYVWVRDRPRRALTVRQPAHPEQVVRRFFPQLLDGVRPSKSGELKKGENFHTLLDSLRLPPAEERNKHLSREQKEVQEGVGALKYPAKTLVALTLPLHRLSQVVAYPPPRAISAMRLCIELMWDAHCRGDGITFGGELDEGGLTVFADGGHAGLDKSAPAELEATGDAQWGTDRDVYGLIVTNNGGAVALQVKKFQSTMDSSYAGEGEATLRVSDLVEHAREAKCELGVCEPNPTTIGTDNSSNYQMALGQASAGRSKHIYRKWKLIKQRLARAVIRLAEVPDKDMPADFLTKWVSRAKLEASIARATNSRNAVAGWEGPEMPKPTGKKKKDAAS